MIGELSLWDIEGGTFWASRDHRFEHYGLVREEDVDDHRAEAQKRAVCMVAWYRQ